MDQFIRNYETLAFCYKKINYFSDYLKADEEDRSKICASEKKRLLDSLNSDEMKFSNFAKLRIKNLTSHIYC